MNGDGFLSPRGIGQFRPVAEESNQDAIPGHLKRTVRRLVRDSLRWAKRLVSRLDYPDEPLQCDLALEAASFGACLLNSQLHDKAEREAALEELRRAWQRMQHGAPDSVIEVTRLLLAGSATPSVGLVTNEKLAKEFQNLTGLSAEAWVGGGSNLAALLFYQRVFARTRIAPGLNAQHRVEIINAARQCKDRFKAVLGVIDQQRTLQARQSAAPNANALGPSEPPRIGPLKQ